MGRKIKRKTKKKKLKKGAFYQNWGTYTNETLVAVNMSHVEIVRWMKTHKAKPEIIAEWEEGKEDNEKIFLTDQHKGVTWTSKNGASLLWFKKWENTWDCFETLVHETRHLVDAVFKDKRMLEEAEACAYQQEFFFRELRRKLEKFT